MRELQHSNQLSEMFGRGLGSAPIRGVVGGRSIVSSDISSSRRCSCLGLRVDFSRLCDYRCCFVHGYCSLLLYLYTSQEEEELLCSERGEPNNPCGRASTCSAISSEGDATGPICCVTCMSSY